MFFDLSSIVFHCFPPPLSGPRDLGSLALLVWVVDVVFFPSPAKCVHLVTLVAKVPMVCN